MINLNLVFKEELEGEEIEKELEHDEREENS